MLLPAALPSVEGAPGAAMALDSMRKRLLQPRPVRTVPTVEVRRLIREYGKRLARLLAVLPQKEEVVASLRDRHATLLRGTLVRHPLALVPGTVWEDRPEAIAWLEKRPPGARPRLVQLRQQVSLHPSLGLQVKKLNPLRRQQLELVLTWTLSPQVRQAVEGWLAMGSSPVHVSKVFPKIEPLTKAARCICPMQDEMNVLLGPGCGLYEKVAGKLPFLVKGMTVPERTERMKETLLRDFHLWAETDFGAFDSTVELIYREIEWNQFCDYLTTQEQLAYIVLICCTILRHVLLDKDDELYDLSVPSMRYSGEPPTSIGNGLINDFVGWSMPGGSVKGLREGDDGFVGSHINTDLAGWGLQLGFNLDVDWHTDFRAVKFCGRFLSGDYNCDVMSVCDVRRTLDKLHLSMGNPGGVDIRSLLRSKLQASWSLDPATPLVSTIVWALWPSVADAKVVVTKQDEFKLRLAGQVCEPGAKPPVVRPEDYECLVYQGICPEAARAHDRAVVAAATRGDALPVFDFGLSPAKVPLFAASGI